jgi:hypothetical protein
LCTAVTERDMTNSWAHRLIPAFPRQSKALSNAAKFTTADKGVTVHSKVSQNDR